MTGVGAVAAGNAHTAAAAAQVLRAGGNAVDAAVAAGFAASVAEPGLASPGGGGFLLCAPPDGPERLLDFFVDAPGRGRPAGAVAPPLLPITLSFAGADQVFSAGWASVAVPGCLDGWLHASRTLGRLPLAQVVAPAARLARDGAVLDETQAGLLVLLREVLLLTEEGRALFAPHGELLRAGERLRNPLLADVLDDVARGSVTGFASLGGRLQDGADRAGALVGAQDLAAYAVVEREPLRTAYRDAEVVTNAPPSFGGTLVLAALEELAQGPRVDGSPAAVLRLADALTRMSDRHLAGLRAATGGTPLSVRGTTHVSVLDADGMLAAMTLSNGSCSGVFVPGTGVQLNNVMGEADLHPHGSSPTPAGLRIGSMMAPTLLRTADGTRTALGSGGSERIRSALLCTLIALVDRAAPLEAAVAAPRLHWDRRVLQVEPGLGEEALAALRPGRAVHEWTARDLYFGGVHAVSRAADGSVHAVGDARRAGVGLVVGAA
jgi:gamma-glutamyltranspeptidase/glutathione hydrolase